MNSEPLKDSQLHIRKLTLILISKPFQAENGYYYYYYLVSNIVRIEHSTYLINVIN